MLGTILVSVLAGFDPSSFFVYWVLFTATVWSLVVGIKTDFGPDRD
jgi:hypothetical protein